MQREVRRRGPVANGLEMMQNIIPVVNHLQVIFAALESAECSEPAAAGGPQLPPLPSLMDLPQVAVVGSQSAGKSSILEGIIGQPCLPRGLGMVTRCPLVLQLRHDGSEDATFRCEFIDHPGVFLTDCEHIRTEIENRTQHNVCLSRTRANLNIQTQSKTTSNDTNGEHSSHSNDEETENSAYSVSPIPIILRISGPDVVDLTLIDLPGLIRVPISKQPQDIDEQIRRIVLQYISSRNCIILAVSAGNVDLANSDSLRIAREVDPLGVRTIGVLTKSDLVEDPKMLISIVDGTVYPLQHGYILVKCRGPNDKCTLKESLAFETQFFESNRSFYPIKDRCGSRYLAGRLSEILLAHIKVFLPQIRVRIDTLIRQTEEDFHALGCQWNLVDGVDENAQHSPGGSPIASGTVLLQIFTRFTRMMDDLLDGRVVPSERPKKASSELIVNHLMMSPSNHSQVAPGDLVGGARLHYIFHDWFAACVMQLNSLAGLTDREIQIAIRNAAGSSTSLFVPEVAFEMLVKRQIKKLEEPALQCVKQAVVELNNIVDYPLSQIPEFRRYINLEKQVKKLCRDVVTRHLNTTLKYVSDHICVELAFINKSHPDFFHGRQAFNGFFLACHRGASGNTTDDKNNSHPEPPMTMSQSAMTPGAGGVSDSEEVTKSNQQQHMNSNPHSFFTVWKRHPLQQTPAPFTLQSRPSGASMYSTTVGKRSSPRVKKNGSYSPIPLTIPINESGSCDYGDRTSIEIDLVKALVSSYFEIVKKTLSDMVPKAIMHLLVNASREDLHKELVAQLYKPELLANLLKEHPEIPAASAKLKKRMKTLYETANILQNINESLGPSSSFDV